MTGVIVGVDVGGTSIHAVAIDRARDEVLAEVHRPTVPGEDGVRSGISDAVRELTGGGPVAGIGVGVPGLVSGGQVTHAVNLQIGAVPVDLTTTLHALTDGPVAVENDVKAAALGARAWLAVDDPAVRDYALLNVGTGLAAGLVVGGRVHRGSTGFAGEIGHLTFDRTGPICKCGKRGCLELYVSGSGLKRSWPGTAAELFATADSGDEHAVALVEDLVAGLSHAITLLAFTLDSERVLVTGGVVSATPPLREAVLSRLVDEGRTPVGSAAAVADRVRWLPADVPVGALGAARLARSEEADRWRS